MTTISPGKSFDLVHVGKCGGISAVTALRAAGYDFKHVHVTRPVPRDDARYVVLVRDPIARFISAFNWRKHLHRSGKYSNQGLVDSELALSRQTEREFLFRFASVDDLAMKLVSDDQSASIATAGLMGLIGHVSMGFQWYLGHLIENIEPSQVIGIICAENFSADFNRLFGFRPEQTLNQRDETLPIRLSEKGRSNLIAEFQLEYDLLWKLQKIADQTGTVMSMRYDPNNGAIPNI